MAIEEMILLNMTFDRQDLDEVLFKLKGSTHFYPQPASKIVNNVKGVQRFEEDSIYTKWLDRLIQIGSDMKLDLNHDLAPEHSLNKEKTESYLKELEKNIEEIKNIQDQLIQEKDENVVTLEMLNKLSLSEVDLDQLKTCQYIKARFGRFPRRNFDKIKYYEGRPFVFNKLGEDRQYVWGCYIVTNNLSLEVDNIFKALGFEEIGIPSFVHGTLEDAQKELENEIHAMEEYILRMDQKMALLRETHRVDLLKLYSTVSFLQRIEAYKVFVVDYQSKCAIYGFLSTRKSQEFKERFKDVSSMEFQELPKHILENQEVHAPTVTHNAKFVKPFEMISKVKQSDQIDTTIAFAILYYAVFIIFLGDIGIGSILLLLGILLRKKDIGKLLLSLSIATFVGGFMYGSVFYTKSLYPAFALPFSTVFKIVDGLVLLGAGSYTIRSVQKMYGENSAIDKFLSMKGICGLIIVYTFLVYLGCAYEAHIGMPVMPFAIVIVACLILILMKSILKNKLTR